MMCEKSYILFTLGNCWVMNRGKKSFDFSSQVNGPLMRIPETNIWEMLRIHSVAH